MMLTKLSMIILHYICNDIPSAEILIGLRGILTKMAITADMLLLVNCLTSCSCFQSSSKYIIRFLWTEIPVSL